MDYSKISPPTCIKCSAPRLDSSKELTIYKCGTVYRPNAYNEWDHDVACTYILELNNALKDSMEVHGV